MLDPFIEEFLICFSRYLRSQSLYQSPYYDAKYFSVVPALESNSDAITHIDRIDNRASHVDLISAKKITGIKGLATGATLSEDFTLYIEQQKDDK